MGNWENLEAAAALMARVADFCGFLRQKLSDLAHAGAHWNSMAAYTLAADVIRHAVDEKWLYTHGEYGQRWRQVADMIAARGSALGGLVDEEFRPSSYINGNVNRIASRTIRMFGNMAHYVGTEFWDRGQDDLRLTTPEMIKVAWRGVVTTNQTFFAGRSRVLREMDRDLRSAFQSMGEPSHAGDLGGGSDPDGPTPWSGQ